MADFNINDHLQKMNFGQSSGGSGEGDGANEKYIFELPFDAFKKFASNTIKAIEGIPIIGPLLAKLFPTNPGEVSMFSGLDSQGFAGKSINPGKGGTQGTNLYTALIAPLIKNGAITDNTGGTGGGGGGGEGGGGGGGSGFLEGSMLAQASFSDIAGVSSGGGYDWSPMSWASLGGLPRPALPDMGGGAEMGVA